MKTPQIKLIDQSPLRLVFVLILLGLACFALSPQAQAVCQEGCLTNSNTVLGDDALINLTTGNDNTAIGFNALFSNTTGFLNTASGAFALYNNTTGGSNTANGAFALYLNTTGTQNTAFGNQALVNNTTGNNNTANGFDALAANTTGADNTANGFFALLSNRTGNENTASGFNALFSSTNGNANTAFGSQALLVNTTGDGNTAIGIGTLLNNNGNNNIALGANAGANLTTGSNNIDIFNRGVASESNTIRIGRRLIHNATFIAGISGATVPTGVAVIVDADGHLGTVVSSERFKDNVQPMDKASEAIHALKPVTFRYKHELDPDGIPQFGLVAEQVEKVNPDLVARDEQGKPYTVRYDQVNAMLLNEFLKEHRKVEQMQKQIDALTAGLQRVSAQLELNKPAQQTVSNDH